jgi:hypothetical protein
MLAELAAQTRLGPEEFARRFAPAVAATVAHPALAQPDLEAFK